MNGLDWKDVVARETSVILDTGAIPMDLSSKPCQWWKNDITEEYVVVVDWSSMSWKDVGVKPHIERISARAQMRGMEAFGPYSLYSKPNHLPDLRWHSKDCASSVSEVRHFDCRWCCLLRVLKVLKVWVERGGEKRKRVERWIEEDLFIPTPWLYSALYKQNTQGLCGVPSQ